MKTILNLIIILAFGLMMNSCVNTSQGVTDESGPVKVELKSTDEGFKMYCNGRPFYIEGAGLEGGNMEALAAHGGNALRTWRTDNQFMTAQEQLDKAQANGLMVCMGLEIGRERHGFDYNDEEAVKKQFEYAKGEVMKYKDHPALLAWGIGNELNLHYSNPKVWDAVNEIAAMIHELDPNHPTTTMFAGAGKQEVDYVMERCPHIDFLSFQIYGDIMNLPKYIAESGWKGAYVVSEWGATGHWEVGKTEWGSPIEQNSHEKALAYRERYEKVIAAYPEQCIGSFVFLWGQKQERTPTWYGMFLESGENTESVDVMQYVWTGNWPANRSPQMRSFTLNSKTAYDNVYLAGGEVFAAEVMVEDPEGDTLNYLWEIIPEVPEHQQSDGGDFEQRQETVFKKQTAEGKLMAEAPAQPGDYRLFIYAFDGHNNAAYANIPFYVKD
jgi:hypothetical protein